MKRLHISGISVAAFHVSNTGAPAPVYPGCAAAADQSLHSCKAEQNVLCLHNVGACPMFDAAVDIKLHRVVRK